MDIYSLGLILLELCTFFKTQSERRITLENVRVNGTIPISILKKYPVEYNLIKQMTDKHPENRPTTEELLNSAHFQHLKGTCDNLETEEY